MDAPEWKRPSWLHAGSDHFDVGQILPPSLMGADRVQLAELLRATERVQQKEPSLSQVMKSLSAEGLAARKSDLERHLANWLSGSLTPGTKIDDLFVEIYTRQPVGQKTVGGPRKSVRLPIYGPETRQQVPLWGVAMQAHDGEPVPREYTSKLDTLRYGSRIVDAQGKPVNVDIDTMLNALREFDLGDRVVRDFQASLLEGHRILADQDAAVFDFHVIAASITRDIPEATGTALRRWATNGSEPLLIGGKEYRFRSLRIADVPVVGAAVLEPEGLSDAAVAEPVILYMPGRMTLDDDQRAEAGAGLLRQFDSAAELARELKAMTGADHPLHAILMRSGSPFTQDRYRNAVDRFARDGDASLIGLANLQGNVWDERARLLSEELVSGVKQAFKSNESKDHESHIERVISGFSYFNTAASMVPVIGFGFDVSSAVNSGMSAYVLDRFGDPEQASQFEREMRMNAFGAALSLVLDVPVGSMVGKLSIARFGQGLQTAIRPLTGLGKPSSRLARLPMDAQTGLRTHQGKSYIAIRGSDGRERFATVEWDPQWESYRLVKDGVLAEPVRFDRLAKVWKPDLHLWAREASDGQILESMLRRRGEFELKPDEWTELAAGLKSLGVDREDILHVLHNDASGVHALTPMAAGIADATLRHAATRLQDGKPVRIGTSVLRDWMLPEIAKGRKKPVVVLAPRTGNPAPGKQSRFLAGYDADGQALSPDIYDASTRVGQAFGGRDAIEVQEILPDVFLSEADVPTHLPDAHSDVFGGVMRAELLPSRTSAADEPVMHEAFIASVVDEAAKLRRQVGHAIAVGDTEALISRIKTSLLPDSQWQGSSGELISRMGSMNRAMHSSHRPMDVQTESDIVRGALDLGDRVVRVEIERLASADAAMGSNSGKQGVPDTVYGPEDATSAIRLRAITDAQGRAITYQHFDDSSQDFRSAEGWEGSPLVSALAMGGKSAVLSGLAITPHEFEKLAAAILDIRIEHANFALSPRFSPFAVTDSKLIAQLDDLFAREIDAHVATVTVGAQTYARVGSTSGRDTYFRVSIGAQRTYEILNTRTDAAGRGTGVEMSREMQLWHPIDGVVGGVAITMASDVRMLPIQGVDFKGPAYRVGSIKEDGMHRAIEVVYEVETGHWIRRFDVKELMLNRGLLAHLERGGGVNPFEGAVPGAAGGSGLITLKEWRERTQKVFSQPNAPREQIKEIISGIQRYRLTKAGTDNFEMVPPDRWYRSKKVPTLEERRAALEALGVDPGYADPDLIRKLTRDADGQPMKQPIRPLLYHGWWGPLDIPEDFYGNLKGAGESFRAGFKDLPGNVEHHIYLSSEYREVFNRNKLILETKVPGLEVIEFETSPLHTLIHQVEDGKYSKLYYAAKKTGGPSAVADFVRWFAAAQWLDKDGNLLWSGGGQWGDMDDVFTRPLTEADVSAFRGDALLGGLVSHEGLGMQAMVNTNAFGMRAGHPLAKAVLDKCLRLLDIHGPYLDQPKPAPGTPAYAKYAAVRAKVFGGPLALDLVIVGENSPVPIAKVRVDVQRAAYEHGVILAPQLLKDASDTVGLGYVNMGSENSWRNARKK